MDIGAFFEQRLHDQSQEGNNPLDETYEPSYAEQIRDYSDVILDEVFIGDYTIDAILEGLNGQFGDYIGTEDTNNYVDIFYDQLYASYEAVREGETEDHVTDKLEALEKIKSRFVSEIFRMFETRLTLTIMTVDDESTDEDEVEYVVRRLYEYFILGAKQNFKTVISKGILPELKNISDDQQYFERIYELLPNYDPLIRHITPTEFMQMRGDREIADLFSNGDVVGNFLRKYSAKLYEHEEFKVEIINYITMIQGVKEEITNGGEK